MLIMHQSKTVMEVEKFEPRMPGKQLYVCLGSGKDKGHTETRSTVVKPKFFPQKWACHT